MTKQMTSILSAALIAGIAFTATAADEKGSGKKPAAKVTKATKPKRDTYPYGGLVGSVDGNVITLKQKKGERKIMVAKDAKIERRSPDKKKTKIKLSDIKVGAYVSGSLKKVDGKETAISVYDRPKPERRSSQDKKKSSKKKAS